MEWHPDMKVAHALAGNVMEGDGGCWLWRGYVDKRGYSRTTYLGKRTSAHRVAWIVYRGEIPSGLVLDHLCRVRHCVNPWHLEPVTSGENTRRGERMGAYGGARKTHCPQGHLYTGANLRLATSSRGYVGLHCRTCDRISSAAYRQKKRPQPDG